MQGSRLRVLAFAEDAAVTFPYSDHRTMAEVLADEADGCTCELPDAHDHSDDCPIIMAMGEAA